MSSLRRNSSASIVVVVLSFAVLVPCCCYFVLSDVTKQKQCDDTIGSSKMKFTVPNYVVRNEGSNYYHMQCVTLFRD